MSGSQWAPYGDVNPAKTWDYSTGTVGLAYETAFRFNPLTGNFIPWLATNGTWRTKSQYVMTIRSGVKFSDGKTLTPKDVKYSFDLLKIPTHPQNALWASTGLRSVRVAGNTVVFTFAGKPGYQQFDFYRYNVAIVPQHVFSKYSTTDLTTGNLDAKKVVGTGPYTYQSGASSTSQTFVWQRRNDWWATKQLGLRPAPRYVVDIHNSSNTAALANFQAGNIDLFNNFAPKSAIKGKLQDLLSQGPVPPRSEHDVALPEHDEEAAERSAVPPGSRLLDQHEPDPRQGVPGSRRTRRARPGSFPSGTSGSTRRSSRSSASRTT